MHSIRIELMYWRKANQIHHFFQTYCADKDYDKSEFDVPTTVLEDLSERCNRILEKMTWELNGDGGINIDYKSHSAKLETLKLAGELLPTSSGFFYGSTEYDEWYYKDIIDTKKMLDKLMKEAVWKWDEYYYDSSW